MVPPLPRRRWTVFRLVSVAIALVAPTVPAWSPSTTTSGGWGPIRTTSTDSSSGRTATPTPFRQPSVATVQAALDRLYPPDELELRNALSRKDGYWAFIKEGVMTPPRDLTYGEFDVPFLAQLLERVATLWTRTRDDASPLSHNNNNNNNNKVFVDIGSGTGRLVVAAAALYPGWKACRGIELLPGIHEKAVETVAQHCHASDGSLRLSVAPSASSSSRTFVHEPATTRTTDDTLPLAPIEFVCGSFDDPHVSLGDSDVLFMFSSAVDQALLKQLSQAIGRACQPGTLVITTDYRLELEGFFHSRPNDAQGHASPPRPYRLELVDTVQGQCWCTGGLSTAYLHRVVESGQGCI